MSEADSEHDQEEQEKQREVFDEMERARTEATRRIVESKSPKKLVVAGPGTGKTYTFQEALRAAGGKGLALTFIRNLVDDLRDSLGDLADVFTLHGFCKHMLHRHPVEGLAEGWDYYPLLLDLLAADLSLLRGATVTRNDIERALHDIDDSENLVAELIGLGNYYNAVSHTDLVYRALRHFEHNDDKIPMYPLVIVDEYQDFSHLETLFIALLGTKSALLIAGDDDQALYGFKNASARYIRDLANDNDYEVFDLPYCSRCTSVIVEAVKDVVARGQGNGNLDGRLEKQFECYLPEKSDDSDAHPKIIHAKCSVQTKTAPYVGRYVARQIAAIPIEDIRESREKGFPTALVIGDKPFMPFAYDVLEEEFPQAQMKKTPPQDVSLLEGYRRIAVDEQSRLGWRIVVAYDAPQGANGILKQVLEDEAEFPPNLPDDYRDHHLEMARAVRELVETESLPDDRSDGLAAAVGLTIDEIRAELAVQDDQDADNDEVIEGATDPATDEEAPTILCTSRLGAKGLSAAYVFVIGFNNGYFPQDANAITDEEVCKLLVALSRTRKECHIVACGRFAADWLADSAFVDWLQPHLESVKADKTYFQS